MRILLNEKYIMNAYIIYLFFQQFNNTACIANEIEIKINLLITFFYAFFLCAWGLLYRPLDCNLLIWFILFCFVKSLKYILIAHIRSLPGLVIFLLFVAAA